MMIPDRDGHYEPWTDESLSDNARRAAASGEALSAFLLAGHGDPDSPEDTLTDLLTDLMHWAEAKGIDPDRCFERAQGHYHAEKEEAI